MMLEEGFEKMNCVKKYGMVVLSSLCLAVPVTTAVSSVNVITAEAHSGRTDANGGHHDYKNKSGLGSYHYHCGGHPAHLHPNGVCPYDSGATTSGSKSSKKESSAPETPTVTRDTMASYADVFDAAYYYSENPDLQTAIGSNDLKLFEHFYNYGMAEGRRASENFDVTVYKNNNSDLVDAFGDNLKQYYDHFIQNGKAEGRVHK